MATLLYLPTSFLRRYCPCPLNRTNPQITLNFSRSLMAWACSKCTFLNPPSQKSTCEICFSPSIPSSSSSSSPLKWSCKACTFHNAYDKNNCEICGTRSNTLSVTAIADIGSIADDELDPSVGSVFFPLKSCKRKTETVEDLKALDETRDLKRKAMDVSENYSEMTDETRDSKGKAAEVLGDNHPHSGSITLKILSYNVWFREDLEVHKRMETIGDLIYEHLPDLICFQEVTPDIYDIFQQSSWWKIYKCSVSSEMATNRPYFCMQLSKLPVKAFTCKPFFNTMMGRELCMAEVDVGAGKELLVATSHLESPCPAPPKWDQMYSLERVAQAKEAVSLLKKSPNVIFGGDMNWNDKLDGKFPLLDGWVDAWEGLRSGENGWTYDTKANRMLSGNRALQQRLDRFVCNLRDFEISGIDMIGLEPIPGLTYCKEKKVRGEVKKLMLPVYPSDHFGLLLTIEASPSKEG